MAIQGFNFRPGAQKVFVLITDEDSDDRDYQATIDLLIANSVTVHTAVDCNYGTALIDYCNDTSVRGTTGGLLFNVIGPYNRILDTIAGSTANTYILRYQSSNSNFDASIRSVECHVNAPLVRGTVSCAYIPGAAPQISLTTETLALNQQAIAEGSSPLISVLVIDQAAPFVQTVTLYYRTTGSSGGYRAVTMTNQGNNRYETTIPGVQSPGIDYYITATDGQVLSTLPSTDPGLLPFQIGVLPNVAPQIQHSPVISALYRDALPIRATVADTTNRVAAVELKWRRVGELIYRTSAIVPGVNNEYVVTIAGHEITTDLEYYLRAVDDLGVAATAGSADNPYRVNLRYGESPVLFIPGMAGSRLRMSGETEDLWINLYEPDARVQLLLTYLELNGYPGAGTALDILTRRQDLAPQLTLDRENSDYRKDIFAADALRNAFDVFPIYGGMLNMLEGNYPAYQLDEEKLPGDDCDWQQSQIANKPRLFVFPYDWRKSNVDNANRLAHYIKECIQQYFYPNSKVDVVAHSMGGLVARRYILDNPNRHDIARVITIGTPWLGAPEFIKVLETGDWIALVKYAMLRSDVLKSLVETFPGAHELLPSDRYFGLVPGTFREEGWDINGNGVTNDIYSPSQYQELLDRQRFSMYQPMQQGRSFHNYLGQDSWAIDLGDVEYHYIVGVQAIPWTIERVAAQRICLMNGRLCTPLTKFAYGYGDGDGTVPLISARRALPAAAPDGRNIQIHELRTSVLQRLEADHLGLMLSGAVQECVLNILRGQFCPAQIRPLAESVGTAATTQRVESAYYVAVTGASNGIIANSTGERTGSYASGLLVENIEGAKYIVSGSAAFDAIVAATDSYTLSFRTGTVPFTVEITERTASNAVLTAARYRDIQLPANTLVQILLNVQSDYRVRYDADNDGRAETELPGMIAGTSAQDITAPQLTVRSEFAGDQLRVTMAAQDNGSGVAAIYYSLDGREFTRYSTPFQVAHTQDLLYAFADDNVSNRAPLQTFRLVNYLHLPFISYVKP
ncbi:MAG TPA: hypothetical protein P5121_38450, partial [Caldilineaceae bacterium]|nr:hypothetical protein [Caldilineaceae bacterium]